MLSPALKVEVIPDARSVGFREVFHHVELGMDRPGVDGVPLKTGRHGSGRWNCAAARYHSQNVELSLPKYESQVGYDAVKSLA